MLKSTFPIYLFDSLAVVKVVLLFYYRGCNSLHYKQKPIMICSLTASGLS